MLTYTGLFNVSGTWPVRPSLLLAALFFAPPVAAETFRFEINNFSLEQTVVSSSSRQTSPSADGVGSQDYSLTSRQASTGSSNVTFQRGFQNSGSSYSIDSPGAALATLQVGVENNAVGIIKDSPGSVIAQAQFGTGNSSVVGIFGGANNHAATVQIGSNLGAGVALVDSFDTKLVYGQAGADYNGGIVIKNAPANTVIKLY